MENLKITIGIPCLTYIHYSFISNLLQLEKPYEIIIDLKPQMVVHTSRNMIVENFLKSKNEYLFFLDSDMVFPKETLKILLDCNKDIVSALAFNRVSPYKPCIMKKVNDKYHTIIDYPKNTLMEIDACGMACTLIKRNVLEKIKKPYFMFTEDSGEDMYFCNKAKESGFSIWVNTALKIGHISDTMITEDTYKKYLEDNLNK